MKRVFKIFLVICMTVCIGGCGKKINSSNSLNKSHENNDSIYNLNESIKGLNGFSFEGIIDVKGEKHQVNGKVILKDTIEKSVININYKDNSFFLNDEKVYIRYKYNKTNIIIKDSLDNFIDEIVESLEDKGVKSNKDLIKDIIKNKGKKDIDLVSFGAYLLQLNENVGVDLKNYSVSLNDYHLPELFEYKNKDIKVSLTLSYEDVSIKIPFGYNLFTMSIDNIKDLLGVNNIGELIK